MLSFKTKYLYIFLLLSLSVQGQNTLFNFPQNFQLFQRDSLSVAHVRIHGTVNENTYDGIRLIILQNHQEFISQRLDLSTSNGFEWDIELIAGLFEYDFEIRLFSDSDSSSLSKATKVLCGDAYLIYGQSNAVASCCFNEYRNLPALKFLRNYIFVGEGDPVNGWRDLGIEFDWAGGLGAWLAKDIIEKQRIPVQIINGGVGGMPLFALAERDSLKPDDVSTFYGKFLRRINDSQVKRVKGFLFLQGEYESSSGDTLQIENYRDHFKSLLRNLVEDGISFEHLYLVQTNIDKNFFARYSAARLREEQRKLKYDYPKIHLYSAFGHPRGNDGVHYTKEGYQGIAEDLYLGIKNHIYQGNHRSSAEGPMVKKVVHDANEKTIRIVFDRDQEIDLIKSIDHGHYQRNIKDFIFDGNNQPFLNAVAASNNEVELVYSGKFVGNTLTYLPSFFSDNFSLTYDGPLIKNQYGLTALSFKDFEKCTALPKLGLSQHKLVKGGVSFSIEDDTFCDNCYFEMYGRSGYDKRYLFLDSMSANTKEVFTDLSWAANVGRVSLKLKVVSPTCESSYREFSFVKCPKELLYYNLSAELESGGVSIDHKISSNDLSNLDYKRASYKAYNVKAPLVLPKIGRCSN
ncbi:MAG: hypothetical protein ACI9DJ_000118 [Algoriphagus sp.]|jgi:hypothetical protein